MNASPDGRIQLNDTFTSDQLLGMRLSLDSSASDAGSRVYRNVDRSYFITTMPTGDGEERVLFIDMMPVTRKGRYHF